MYTEEELGRAKRAITIMAKRNDVSEAQIRAELQEAIMLLAAVMIPMYRRSGLSVNSPDQNRHPRSLSPGLPKR